jgi:cellulose synthase/poly-beta-1,6-N-acetylglucosamine synthase-like glycosyltransferase
MRLARFGYRSAMIHSTTYEEAPARFGAWLRQRTRWFKGWMRIVNGYFYSFNINVLVRLWFKEPAPIATLSQRGRGLVKTTG